MTGHAGRTMSPMADSTRSALLEEHSRLSLQRPVWNNDPAFDAAAYEANLELLWPGLTATG